MVVVGVTLFLLFSDGIYKVALFLPPISQEALKVLFEHLYHYSFDFFCNIYVTYAKIYSKLNIESGYIALFGGAGLFRQKKWIHALNPYIALLCWYSLRCCINFIWLHYSSNKLRFLPASTMSCFSLETEAKINRFGNFLKIFFCQETVEKLIFERTPKEIWKCCIAYNFFGRKRRYLLHLYPWEKSVGRFIFYKAWTDIDIVEGEKTYVTCKFSSWQLLFCFRQHMHILQPNQHVPHNIVSAWHEVFKTL